MKETEAGERVESYRRRDILEMDGKKQRGTDREEEAQGNRQRGET